MTEMFEKPFGRAAGRRARLFVLDSGSLRVGITDFGCTVVFIKTKDKRGETVNAVQGYESAEGYAAGSSSFGATVGRYAGRIGGSRFMLNGREYHLEPNDGANHLHGGFNKRFWDAEPIENGVSFTLLSPDMDEGFPGELRVNVTASLEGSVLRLVYEAVSQADTFINLTNHSYFNLNGGGTVSDHLLWVNAESYAETDGALIPTGNIKSVSGTPLDHTKPVPLEKAIRDPMLAATRGLDHSFILGRPEGEGGLVTAAKVYSPDSGITLICRTTQPTVHIYTAGFADLDSYGSFERNCAVCLETQHLPDSPNKPQFPSTLLKRHEPCREVTEYEFGLE